MNFTFWREILLFFAKKCRAFAPKSPRHEDDDDDDGFEK
jgi:hypothetical protein